MNAPLFTPGQALTHAALAPGHYRLNGRDVYWTGRVHVGLRFQLPAQQPGQHAELLQEALLRPRRTRTLLAAALAAVMVTACGGGDPDDPLLTPEQCKELRSRPVPPGKTLDLPPECRPMPEQPPRLLPSPSNQP